ncbi:MAG: DNA replication/repair protein RecF [Rhodobacteraceae bacterium]|nr:DNA replication/repair protein RecF [Paracoccaceae bacterium]
MRCVFVSDLRLSHFRSHCRAVLPLDGRPVVLFGANGAGKTNVLEAVSLLSPGRGLRRATADELVRQPEGLGWKIEAKLDGVLSHEVETWAEPGQGRRLLIDGKSAPQIALAQLLRVIWLVPRQDRLWIEGADGRRQFFDRMALGFFPEHADAVLTYEKAMRERNRLLKNQIRDTHWYSAVEAQMAGAAARITRTRIETLLQIHAAQEEAETAFPAAKLTLAEAEGGPEGAEADAKAYAEAFAAARPRDFATGRTLFGPHRSDITAIYAAKGVVARQCSTGEQKALLISLILSNARALKAETGTAPLVLLDEIAAHLDADRRAALFDEVCALDTQAWMTGTGPELFIALGTRAQYIAVEDRKGKSMLQLLGYRS